MTRARIRNYSTIMLVVGIVILGYLAATSHGMHDYSGRILGTDFSNVYAAGTYVRDGAPQAPFDPDLQWAREKQLFGANADFYSWNYPPYFLFLALPLSAMGYLAALLLYQLGTFAAYLLAMRRILPVKQAWLPALGFGAVVVNFSHGNNGFLTAALFAGGLVSLRTRPLLAGMLLACLIYKPQYGIFIPFALAAGGHWRAFFSATLAVVALTLLSVFAFGTISWQAWADSAAFTQHVLLEQGNTGFFKMQSLFAWERALGGSLALAYGVQAAALLFAFAGMLVIWRSTMDFSLKAAALILATLLAVPYSFDYDLMLLAAALVFMVEHGLRKGFAPYEKTILMLSWWMPFFARPLAQHTLIFLGPVCLLALFNALLRRWREYLRYGRSPA